MTEHLGNAGAVLDETGFVKKGPKSAGVQRHDTGTAGRTGNSQVGVFLGYASQHGHALIDRRPARPRSGPRTRTGTGRRVPEAVAFTTKPKLGLAMSGEPLGSTSGEPLGSTPERSRAAGVPFSGGAGDSVYGADHALRRWAERHGRGTVLAVTSGQRLGLRPVTAWTKTRPWRAWQRLSAGDGAKGRRFSDWACVPTAGRPLVPGARCWSGARSPGRPGWHFT